MRTSLLLQATIGSLLLVACGKPAPAPEPTSSAAEPVQQATSEVTVPQYSAQTFFDTTTLYGSSINHDGTAVLVTSDASGIYNVYSYPVDGSEPTQLTNSTTDAIRGISWFPKDNRLLYTADQGGNELNHVYVRLEDGTTQDLTPGEELKAMVAGWHEDDTHFYVMTNERDNRYFDLYRYSADDFSRTMVFENNTGFNIESVSPNGRYLALSRTNSNADSDLFLVDLQADTVEPKLLNPTEGAIQHSAYTFTVDSNKLIYGTDGQGEFFQAWEYDIANDKHSERYAADWDVSFLYFSESGRYQVVGVNADARTELSILDQSTGKQVQLPEHPPGDLRGVNFSDDESTMVFYVNSDVSPSNLMVWQVGSDSVAQLSNTLAEGMNPEHLVQSSVERFESFDELTVPGLLYKPHQASADNKVPAIIFIHGGPGGQTRQGYSAMVQHLVNHGYAMFGVNNRGSSGYGKTFFHLDDKRHGEDDLQDIVYGKKYLQTLDWVDPDRIAVMGGSYGGYLTMAALAFTDEFDAGINIFGVTNWVRTLESIPPWWESFRQSLYDELGDPAVDGERLRAISPLFHADRIKAPVLVVQGANDPRVLQVESDEMVEAIRANNVPVEYVLFDDEGHGFAVKENRIEAQEAYLKFLETYLQ
ncbi:S9 family peptidase [Pseudidiomarina gelatinasegens]|uniref:S9 family peptidase n=1 Tax=Pseudidiomarina gelatinasegens TaxID=2487740 RepID=A0A443YYF2_9GAMM|nr:S9 family peptidase [Pseudidiomarina gelatinasegens]RWU09120.1 S9 family peptidase [Pseudidiomarina gelatinasegens]